MDHDQVIWQVYPLGFCDAPYRNDGKLVHRIRRFREWILYLDSFGITAVLFNPVFESDCHGYDTRDFGMIDCRLGDEDDFISICDELHDHGIQVILDGVFNHVGRGFHAFQDVLKNRQDSPYCSWFFLDFSKTGGRDGFSYQNWEGHNELVKLNLSEPEVRRMIFERTDQWIAMAGIDGMRIDVAYMIDQDFLRALCDHIRSYDPSFYFIGEMTGGDYNHLLHDHLMDSVTDYDLYNSVIRSFTENDLHFIHDCAARHASAYPGAHLLNFCDNHDVDRIASRITDVSLVYDILFALPGIPCIYYGSEWGAKGKRTRFSDRPLRPSFRKPVHNALSEHVSRLCHMHKDYRIFADGDYHLLYISDQQYVFRRRSAKGQLTFAVNISGKPARVNVDVEVGQAIELLQKKKTGFTGTLELAAKSAYFWYSDWI